MRVLGIDPGLATTGYGVVERDGGRLRCVTVGAIRTPGDQPTGARLALLRAALAEIVTQHQPDAVALERLFFNSNVKTAMAVGQASGVALATVAERGIEVADYTPPEIKLAVVGVGNASKRQVQVMVAQLLALRTPPRPPDAADACALAICHLHRSGLKRAINVAERRRAG